MSCSENRAPRPESGEVNELPEVQVNELPEVQNFGNRQREVRTPADLADLKNFELLEVLGVH